jgi:FkbM family methyltransferase
MPFVSYAQNYEDVLLWRALGHIENGFYIDVGACEPEADSVTKVFYDRGWSGVNVEPMPGSYARLAAARPRDVNLMVALEDRPGSKNYFAVDGGNGMSSGDQDVRNRLVSEGASVEDVPTVVRTLADLCDECAPEQIHFLKIDVEGSEHLVIAGGDWSRFRPWVVMGEVVHTTLVDGKPRWGSMLDAAGYLFATYDGLNAVYVAREHADLLPALQTPPNFHDGFITAREAALLEVATVVGLDETAGAAEIVARVHGLFADRIKFEHEANALREGAEIAAPPEDPTAIT